MRSGISEYSISLTTPDQQMSRAPQQLTDQPGHILRWDELERTASRSVMCYLVGTCVNILFLA